MIEFLNHVHFLVHYYHCVSDEPFSLTIIVLFLFLYLDISFTQEVVRGTVHQFLDSDDSLVLEDVGSGCRVKGHVLTDKVAGNFKFQVSAKQRDTNNLVIASQASFYPNLDLSHVVHNIYFEGKNDVVSQLLGGLVSPNTPLKNQVTSLASGLILSCRQSMLPTIQ